MQPALALLAALAALSCSFPPDSVDIEAVVPEAPGPWVSVLGEPEWRFLWYGPDGVLRSAEGPGASIRAELPASSSSPVLAFPHWPRAGVAAGTFRPAGAVHPFGAEGGVLRLTWRGGVSAFFFRELLLAGGGGENLPERFDWPRFSGLVEAAPFDPWLADWRAAAVRTRLSGFDSRLVRPRETVLLRIPAPAPGPWVASSPFAAPTPAAEDGFLELAASAEPDTLLSPAGALRFGRDAWAWFPRR